MTPEREYSHCCGLRVILTMPCALTKARGHFVHPPAPAPPFQLPQNQGSACLSAPTPPASHAPEGLLALPVENVSAFPNLFCRLDSSSGARCVF